MPSVHIVIVNYRTGALVADCLTSLASERHALRGGAVVIVDNASGDESLSIMRAAVAAGGWSDWVHVEALPRNGGFAYGNNAAITIVRRLDPDFGTVVLLNPDTVVRPGAIAALTAFLEREPGAGIVGASIEGPGGHAEPSAHRDPSPLGELESAAQLGVLSRLVRPKTPPAAGTARSCDWVSGACMAIRREVLDAVGPLDEAFFLYFEEVDYCARARRLGWRCWFVPEARIVHLEGASTGITVRRRRRPPYWYDSRRRFFVKRYGVAGLVAADLLWALGRASLVARRLVGLGGRAGVASEPDKMAHDLLLGDLRAIVSGSLHGIPRHA